MNRSASSLPVLRRVASGRCPSSVAKLVGVLAGAGFALLGATHPAGAQDLGVGVPLQLASPALRADAYAINLNPATLVWLEGMHTAFNWFHPRDALSTPDPTWRSSWLTGFGSGEGLAIGLGGDWVRDRVDWNVFSLAIAGGSERVSIGWARRWYGSRDNSAIDDFHASDLALAARPTNWLALTGLVRNVGRADLAGVETPRSYQISIAGRLPSDLLSIELGYEGPEDDFLEEDGELFGALVTMPVDGVRLFADARALPFDDGELIWVGGGLELSAGPLIVSSGARSFQQGSTEWGALATAEISVPVRPHLVSSRDTLLRIDLSGDFTERDGFSFFGGGGTPFTDILVRLDRLARENEMAGLYLHLDSVAAGPAQLWELRRAIDAVRDSGKTIVVYLASASVKDLYLASGANLIVGAPTLSVLDTGIGVRRTYLATLLENLRVEAQFVRIGEWKSAPERFTNSGPSEQAQEQLGAYLDAVWAEYSAGVGVPEGSGESIDADWILDAPLLADELVAAGFLHDTGYEDELDDLMEEHLGESYTSSFIYDSFAERDRDWVDGPSIAVLHIDGVIQSGSSSSSLFGGLQTGATAIETACSAIAGDSGIGGVIVRIDSPGGSALASDEILRALDELASEKPLVISMGDIAASGGYYVAATGDRIFATPVTLTGSIGIYAGTLVTSDLLRSLGVNEVRDDRGGPHDFYSGRAWDEEDEAAVFASIEEAYRIFLGHVAGARGRTTEEIDAVGQGHIWTGEAGLGNGLVDDVGGFLAARNALCEEIGGRCGPATEIRHFPSAGDLTLSATLAHAFTQERPWERDVETTLAALGLDGWLESVWPLLSNAPGTPLAHFDFVDAIP